MAQTTVQNERSIRLGSAKLLVDGVDIGALQNAKLEVKMEVFQLKPDNAELTPRKKFRRLKSHATRGKSRLIICRNSQALGRLLQRLEPLKM